MYSGKDYYSRTKKGRGKRVREEAIYSRGRLAGGWSAGRQVVCLRHNRTGRTRHKPTLKVYIRLTD
jgi:hypothetical protein